MRPEDLTLEPLHCSLGPELGDYYQDFRPAVRLVESGYHGSLDASGIPKVRYQGQGECYNPITTAQYAIGTLAALGHGDDTRGGISRRLLDSLVASQASEGELRGFWILPFDNPKYGWLRAPWVSALAQGNALSALLRGHELLGDDRYREAAEAGYRALHSGRGALAVVEADGEDLWYEEYPARPPLHVLNGHVYALFGVLDYARVTGDAEAHERWRSAADTVARHLGHFDLGYWSGYDARTREPVDVHYHKNIHLPQLRILGELVGDSVFAEYAERWERYLESPVSRMRRAVAVRWRGVKKRLGA